MKLTTESSAPLYSYLPLTSNILLATRLLQTHSKCSFLDIRHQISHTHTRVSQMKTLNIFYLIIYWTHKVHNDIFYIVSIAFHTSVPVLQKYMDTSRKKRLLAESAATRAPPAAPVRWTWKTCLPSPLWVVWRCENPLGQGLASTADVEGTQRPDLGLLQTGEPVVWGWALSSCNKTPVLRSPRRLDLIAGCRWFLRRSAYVALVTVFLLGT
jgi:hypothetical protein